MPHFLGWKGPHESCHPETASQEKEKGTSAFKVKAYERAIECYTRAIHFDPTNEKLFGNRALCKLRLRSPDFKGALKDCTTALSLNPDWAKLWVRRAECLIKMEDYEGALYDMKLGMTLDSSFASGGYFQQLLSDLSTAIPDCNSRLQNLSFDLSGEDHAEVIKRTLNMLNIDAASTAGMTEEELEKLRTDVIKKLELLESEPNAEFDKMANAQVMNDLRKLAVAKTKLPSLPRTEAKWIISCSTIGRKDEETEVLEWMLNVCCTESGVVVGAGCTNLDPTAEALWHTLAKSMAYPLATTIAAQIPSVIIVANRLRKTFTKLESLASTWSTVVLQSAEDEKLNAEKYGNDPDGYNFDKNILKGPYKLPDEYKDEVPESESEDEGMVTDSPIPQVAARADIEPEVMDVDSGPVPSQSKD